MPSLGSCQTTKPTKSYRMVRKSSESKESSSKSLLFEEALPGFSKALERDDYEFYDIILDYKAPTYTQLMLIKDSLGQHAYDLLTEQTLLYEIFQKGLNVQNEIKEIEFITKIVSYSTDYRNNEKVIRLLGDKWKNASIIDSLLINKYFDNASSLIATLRSKYDFLHIDLKSFTKKTEIEKMKGYTFLGTAGDQEIYFERILFLHNESIGKMIKNCNEFIKNNYSNFIELNSYLESKYPKVKIYLSNQTN